MLPERMIGPTAHTVRMNDLRTPRPKRRYDSSLRRLRAKFHALKQSAEEALILREREAAGELQPFDPAHPRRGRDKVQRRAEKRSALLREAVPRDGVCAGCGEKRPVVSRSWVVTIIRKGLRDGTGRVVVAVCRACHTRAHPRGSRGGRTRKRKYGRRARDA